ncbi:uncharacterized protein LOC129308909 [Prosopis cineraria]|uniref:uncharacterized protein LOC129308909 n=1 Tax=Prosopis cineraria TaxID=364024 RepID=UPI00240EBDBA|nr:uncharacterized protein LOC129308909 [Prosopis cineraria]
MPFSLKNAGATYQRAMVALFHDMMHKEIEVYVDDMVAKSTENESHVGVLKKLFVRLREYRLRLNPNKCIFRALFGKLLGFIVSRRVLKWQVVLSEYDIKHVMQKSIKGSAIAYHLADNPLKDDQPLDFQFLDESIYPTEEGCDEGNDKEQEWEMYFDGATNMHGNRVGAVIVSPEGKQFPVAIKLEFDCTNNIAEYKAYVNGLRAAITLDIQCLKVFSNSALIIHQVTGEWRTKDVKLIPYQELLTDLIKQFKVVSFHHLTRDKNRFADALATLAAMIQLDCRVHVQPIQVEARSFPAYCLNVEEDQEEYPWFDDIKDYITKRSYPTGMTENEKKTLHHLAMTFFISKDVLYKKGYDGTSLCEFRRSKENHD